MTIIDYMQDGLFWVAFTFCLFIAALLFQGYWTHWAHTRLDGLRSEVEEMRKECERIKAEMREINERNPFTFIRKVKQ